MSRRSAGDQMAEDAAAGCIFVVFLALWAAISGLIIAVVKAVQTSPEDQLRKMGAQQIYGAEIIGRPCPSCQETNDETAKLCFHCGSSMTRPPKPPVTLDSESIEQYRVALGKFAAKPSRIREGKTYMDAEIPIAVIAGVGLLLFLIFIPIIF